MEYIDSKMSNKRVLVPLMNGFEETEYIAVRDVLIREGIDVDSVSLTGEKLLTANHNTVIGADLVYGKQNIFLGDYDAIFIPGGGIGVENLDKSLEFDSLVNDFYSNDKVVGAICAAPSLLAKRGMLKGVEAVVFPDKQLISILEKNEAKYFADEIYKVDRNIATGKDFASSIQYGYALANLINDWK